jgi:hypothetical protein
MLSAEDLARLQREQFRHDQRNHSDIQCLAKADRLKHYGLHFAKYVGRLARGHLEPKSVRQTVVDTALVSLSAANTMHQRLDECSEAVGLPRQVDPLRVFADAAGRFADACEKIDHYEEGRVIALAANRDVMVWAISFAIEQEINLAQGIRQRRLELAARAFYVAD